MADSMLRQRKPRHAEEAYPTESSAESSAESKLHDEDADTPWLDVLRVLSFLFLASCGLSYWISGGESFFWYMKEKPTYLRADWWKAQMVCSSDSTRKRVSACLLANQCSTSNRPCT